MIRFRHLISKQPKLDHPNGSLEAATDDPCDVNAYTPLLPTELWLLVISLLEEASDLFSLSHTSGVLRDLVLPIRTVTVFPSTAREYPPGEDASRQFRTLRAFRDTSLAATVTEFRVRLPCLGPPGTLCTCSSMDATLGTTLHAMVNLEVLDLVCVLCPYQPQERHHYFSNMDPRRLRHVSFQCFCTEGPFWCETMLSAPVFNTVEALRWSSSNQAKVIPWAGGLNHPTDLPHLTALAHLGSSLENELLTRRHIRRICSSQRLSENRGFLSALEASPGILTHVVLEKFFDLRTFVKAMPLCFSNIQHIGTLPPIPHDKNLGSIDSYLAPFTSLYHLTSFDALVVDGRDPWDAQSLARLRETHHNLRRVLIRGDQFYEWLLTDMDWKARIMPRFSAWDIIREACDET